MFSKKIVLGIAVCACLSGCVRVEMKPEKLVSETVSATKDAYQAIKRKATGTQEREFIHRMPMRSDADSHAQVQECIKFVKRLAEDASERKTQILSESTEVINGERGQTLTCAVRAII